MPKVNKSKKLRNAVQQGNQSEIIQALMLYDNIQTRITQFYKIKNNLASDVRENIFQQIVKPHLRERKLEAQNRVVKEVPIDYKQIKPILKDDETTINKFIYQLINTGRRINELVYEFVTDIPRFDERGRALIPLSKEKIIHPTLLLDGDQNKFKNDLKEFSETLNPNSVSTQTRRVLKKYKIPLTAHDLRGVYVALIHKFYQPPADRKTISQIANEELGHTTNTSDKFYTKIIYTGQNPFQPNLKYENITIKQLKQILKNNNIAGYSKLTRANRDQFIDKLTCC